MAARAPAKKPRIQRRRPIQGRSQATVDAILTATAQILVSHGALAATTNAIAARAGVSIGSLYQYFADRDAIFVELIRRHVEAMKAVVVRGLSGLAGAAIGDAIGPLIAALIAAHRVAPRLHQALHQLAPIKGGATLDAFEDFAAARVCEAIRGRPELEIAEPALAATVLVLALGGIMRTTLRRDPERIEHEAFEGMLVDLVIGFLAQASGRASGRATAR